MQDAFSVGKLIPLSLVAFTWLTGWYNDLFTPIVSSINKLAKDHVMYTVKVLAALKRFRLKLILAQRRLPATLGWKS